MIKDGSFEREKMFEETLFGLLSSFETIMVRKKIIKTNVERVGQDLF